MDLEYYKNFRVLAQSENFSTAAHELNIGQTSLGAQINKLENYYGVKLFNRQKGIKRITLTNAGVDFLHKVNEICKSEEELSLEMQKYSGTVTGTLHIGVSHLRSNHVIEKYLAPFFRLHPEITCQYDVIIATEQIEQIRNGTLDFAFANAIIPAYPEFELITLEEEQFYAFYRSDLQVSWADKEFLVLEDLLDLPLCSNTVQFALLRRICDERFIKLNVNFMSNTFNSTMALVKNSDNIGLLATTPDDEVPRGITRKLINDPRLRFHQTFYWNKSKMHSRAAQVYLDFFRNLINNTATKE